RQRRSSALSRRRRGARRNGYDAAALRQTRGARTPAHGGHAGARCRHRIRARESASCSVETLDRTLETSHMERSMRTAPNYAVFLFPQAVESLGPAIKPYLREAPVGQHIVCAEI